MKYAETRFFLFNRTSDKPSVPLPSVVKYLPLPIQQSLRRLSRTSRSMIRWLRSWYASLDDGEWRLLSSPTSMFLGGSLSFSSRVESPRSRTGRRFRYWLGLRTGQRLPFFRAGVGHLHPCPADRGSAVATGQAFGDRDGIRTFGLQGLGGASIFRGAHEVPQLTEEVHGQTGNAPPP